MVVSPSFSKFLLRKFEPVTIFPNLIIPRARQNYFSELGG